MKDPFLPEYNGFSQLCHRLKYPEIHSTGLDHILQNVPNVWGLNVLDTRVGGLLQGHFDLTDAGGAFFKSQQTWREWDKGVSEVSVLSFWQQSGVLQATAFPPTSLGTTAPFDASLFIFGLTIAGDIKTATTAASGVLLDKFEPELQKWASIQGRITPEIELHINGSLDLRRLNPKWGDILTQFNIGLSNLKDDEITITMECPLPGDSNDPIGAGNLEVRARLIPPMESPTHTWSCPTLHRDSAGNVREPAVEFARSLLEDHAKKKGHHTDEKGNKPPFILAYHCRGKLVT